MRRIAVAVLLAGILVGTAALGIDLLRQIGAGPNESAGSPSADARTASPIPSPSPAASPGTSLSPSPAASPGTSLSPSPTASPGPSPTPPPSPSQGQDASPSASQDAALVGAAPTGSAGFRVRDTVVAMGFPLQAGTRFRYGDGWRAPRSGVVHPYNQIRGVTSTGSQLRAHDGLDLVVPTGTLVVSPFDGIVVDPRDLWTPWDPERYGKVVVVRSTEPTSPGYVVMLAHLSRESVTPGQAVRRGQVVGRTGRTGNASGAVPHLHVELRAPFLIRFGYAGVIRRLDAFDIEPSLRAADRRGR